VKLFVFGLGYSALAFIRLFRDRFAAIEGTVRSADKARLLAAEGIVAHVFPAKEAGNEIVAALATADAVLVSIPPLAEGDPVLARFAMALARVPQGAWFGYLSTIGVYGDWGGAWVDETTRPQPINDRSRHRLAAENAWLEWGRDAGRAVHIFRLAGIYGPGSNALVNLARGTAKRIVKPGQVFNRIQVEDIATALMASIDHPRAGAVYNITDDEPAPAQDVVAFAADLLGIPPPPEVPFDPAAMTPMGAEFYAESKRASNGLAKRELGWAPRYPTFREGLAALHAAGEGGQAA
jgi:nucleoside-diphosphate-sugar epimerase